MPALLLLLIPASGIGQGGAITIQPGVVVIGQCNGYESQPGCVIPSLFGSGGLTLANNPAFPHFAHFVGSAQNTLNTDRAVLAPVIGPQREFCLRGGEFTRQP